MIKNLTSLRFVFMVLIVMSHFRNIGLPQFDFGGECGVAFFFMLSGFVLSLRYGREIEDGTFRHRRFVLHQVSKFYPLHLAILAVSVALDARMGFVDTTYLLKLIPTVLLVQSWIPDQSFYFMGNAVSWFLSDMIFLYVMFPFAYKLMHRRPATVALTTCTVIVVYFVYLTFLPVDRYNDLVYAPPYLRLIDFTLGILAYRFYRALRCIDFPTLEACGFEAGAILMGILTFGAYPGIDYRFHCAALMWPMAMAFTLIFSLMDDSSTPLARLLHSRALQFCGRITFEVFLLHTFVIWNVFVILKKTGLNQWLPLSALICFAAVIVVAWAVHKWFTPRMSRLFMRTVYNEKKQK